MLAAERPLPTAAAALGRDAAYGGATAGLPLDHEGLGGSMVSDSPTQVQPLPGGQWLAAAFLLTLITHKHAGW